MNCTVNTLARVVYFIVVAVATLPSAARCEEVESGPRSPAEEARTFEISDSRLIIELVAAEPDVIDPVACAWDEDGRMYVAEMRDYPVGPPGGTIRRLTDRSGDGRYDHAEHFAEGLAFPNSVLPYRGGLFVSVAPDVIYLKDTNGDGRADVQRVVLTGLAEGNQQLRANGLTWGLDGWVYVANGRSDGELRHPDDPTEKSVSIRRHDFRFHPETGEIEPLTGFSQFGLTRDDWGNRFLSWNTIPMRHAVVEERDLRRNPHLIRGEAVALILDPGDTSRIFPISKPPRTFNRESVQHFNASCGLALYRGDWLPEEYYGNALVCESLTNLVHRRVLKPHGSTFLAERPQQEREREFLASTDPWFRPVNLANGPDGALYVVDFYREWVEHPQFVAEGLRGDVDFRVGDDRGRLWRIRPKTAPVRDAQPKLSQVGTGELVALLKHRSGWWRDTACRLLVERRDPATRDLLLSPESPLTDVAASAAARVAALYTVLQNGGCPDDVLARMISDAEPRVREAAVKVAGKRVANSTKLAQATLARATDDDPAVRFAVALALGNLRSEESTAALAKLATGPDTDGWLRLAVFSGLVDREAELLAHVVNVAGVEPTLIMELAEMAGRDESRAQLDACLALLRPEAASIEARLAIAVGLGGNAAVASSVRTASADLSSTAESVLTEGEHPIIRRVMSIELLAQSGHMPPELLLRLLDAAQAPEVRTAAIRAVGRIGDEELATQALGKWEQMPLAGRRELLAALSRPAVLPVIIGALEDGTIAPTELDAAQREALRTVAIEEHRSRLEQLLPAPSTNRQQVVEQFATASIEGDRNRGAAVFGQHCLTCHRLQDAGHRVGPDLSSIGSRPTATLLIDLLDPSREIAPDYTNFVVETDEGDIHTGLLVSESAVAVVLRGAAGEEKRIPRENLVRLQATGKSLMPEGFEQKLDLQAVADLLAFLRQPDAKLLPTESDR